MHTNITQRLGQRLIYQKPSHPSKENSKRINEELLEMVTNIRALEDQLIAEQYRQELLLEQHEVYNSKLQKLNSRNTVQRQRIAKLEEEYEIYKVKNYQLQVCEESLRSIYEEIGSLTRVVENRAEECEMVKIQKNRLMQENNEIKQRNSQFHHQQQYLNNLIFNFIRKLSSQNPAYQSQKPLSALRHLHEDLISQMIGLQGQNKRVQRQSSSELNFQRQAIIKLKYEQQLLRQRKRDQDKIQKLSQLCASQSNLELVVQQMLVKEDQLLDTLSSLEQAYARQEKSYHLKLQKLKNIQQESEFKFNSQIRQLHMQRDSIKNDQKQIETKITLKNKKYQQIFHEQEMSVKMDINLSSLKRLREVQERNKYLKLKISQLQETQSLLIQQKELLYSQI